MTDIVNRENKSKVANTKLEAALEPSEGYVENFHSTSRQPPVNSPSRT